MTKGMKTASVLLTVYCSLCILTCLCMRLYTTFFPSGFSSVCFKVGVFLAITSAINPLGLCCAIVNLFGDFRVKRETGAPPRWHIRLWLLAGIPLSAVCWCLCICSFVYHSGGV